MSYTVVFSNDPNYDSAVFDAIKDRSTIVDLTDAADHEAETKIVGKVDCSVHTKLIEYLIWGSEQIEQIGQHWREYLQKNQRIRIIQNT
jgi:hypothetical protein